MNSVERVKELCKERKIPISRLEKDLGFSNGYIGQLRKGIFPADRLRDIADYLGVSVDYLLTGEDESTLSDKKYYINDETAEMAERIFHSKELRMLFDAAQDAAPEDLETVHSMLLALKRKERGNIDD